MTTLFNGVDASEISSLISRAVKKPSPMTLMREVLSDEDLLNEVKVLMENELPALDTQIHIAVRLSKVASVEAAMDLHGFTYSAICGASQRIINKANQTVAASLGHKSYPVMRNGKLTTAPLLLKSDAAPTPPLTPAG